MGEELDKQGKPVEDGKDEGAKKEGLRTSQVFAGALAAATAAVLGSTLGMAGTVIGAAIASVVSTVGGALYLRSLDRTAKGVRTVRERVVTRRGSVVATGGEKVQVSEVSTSGDTGVIAPPARRRPRPLALAAAAVVVFAMGMAVVTGLEWVRGEQLSGGSGTTLGGLVAERTARVPEPTTTTVTEVPEGEPGAGETTTPPVGEPEDPTGAPAPTTTTAPPTSSTTTTTTTTTGQAPPTTTTTAPSVAPTRTPAG